MLFSTELRGPGAGHLEKLADYLVENLRVGLTAPVYVTETRLRSAVDSLGVASLPSRNAGLPSQPDDCVQAAVVVRGGPVSCTRSPRRASCRVTEFTRSA